MSLPRSSASASSGSSVKEASAATAAKFKLTYSNTRFRSTRLFEPPTLICSAKLSAAAAVGGSRCCTKKSTAACSAASIWNLFAVLSTPQTVLGASARRPVYMLSTSAPTGAASTSTSSTSVVPLSARPAVKSCRRNGE